MAMPSRDHSRKRHRIDTSPNLLQLLTVSASDIPEMILELLDQSIDLTPSRSPPSLQDKPMHGHAEHHTRKKPDHESIGEHLIRHISHLPLPKYALGSVNIEGFKYIGTRPQASSYPRQSPVGK